MVTVLGNVAEFRFCHPSARQMFSVGDLNDWRQGEPAMTREASSYRWVTMRLPMGDFHFCYCADGKWYSDYAAFGVTPGPHGHDSIIHIGPNVPRPATPRRDVSQAAASIGKRPIPVPVPCRPCRGKEV